MITVYQLAHSPFCIPVVAILKAFQVQYRVKNIKNGDRREIIELTGGAYYQVPVIVDDRRDRRVVFESGSNTQDVAHYLDDHVAGGRLFPPSGDGLQDVLLWHLDNEVEGITFRLQDPFYIDSIDDAAERVMTIRHKERKFGFGCVERWRRERDALMTEAATHLTPYDRRLRHSPYLLGDKPVYADFLLFGILGNLTYNDHNEIPTGLSALIDWQDRMSEYQF